MWWWIAVAALLAAAIAALFSDIRTRVVYYREGENDEVDLKVRALFGLVRLRYQVPTFELKPMLKGFRMDVSQSGAGLLNPTFDVSRREIETFVARARRLLSHMNDYRKWMTDSMRHVHVAELSWTTQFGLGDAADTGMAAGVVWSVKSAIVGVASQMMTLDARPNVRVDPLFGESKFRTDVVVVSKVRVHRSLAMGIMLMYRVLRRKGGWKVWVRELVRRPVPGK